MRRCRASWRCLGGGRRFVNLCRVYDCALWLLWLYIGLLTECRHLVRHSVWCTGGPNWTEANYYSVAWWCLSVLYVDTGSLSVAGLVRNLLLADYRHRLVS